jgi:hypothetical protein
MDVEQIEQHADLEHEIWSSWMQYMFTKGTFNPDGTWTMPAWAVERWGRQMRTPYSDLSEREKESDREQVQKHLSLIETGRIDRTEGTLLKVE